MISEATYFPLLVAVMTSGYDRPLRINKQSHTAVKHAASGVIWDSRTLQCVDIWGLEVDQYPSVLLDGPITAVIHRL